nr:MAG TPA: hypothetical protein [Bacteriophage sp.]
MAVGIDIISDTTGKEIAESIRTLGLKLSYGEKKYGFHINGSDSDPSTRVTYLADAVGMTPAKMNFTDGVFSYGSWGDAFFMPRPCMLKTDGTVDYYLDENDYSKRADGVTASDIANVDYDGNAMIEWGNGTDLIWWKIVPDKGDSTSASAYVANYQADGEYRCLNFTDINNDVKQHFYTPIYNGSLDSNNKLRSISGQSVMRSKTASAEMGYAKANGENYEIEQYVDRLLINILLILISKSTDTQGVFGPGASTLNGNETNLLQTGTMDSKGMFWGENTGKLGVKVFGMENYWGNQWRRTAGYILANGIAKVKLSPSKKDGSKVSGYNTDGTGYIEISSVAPSGTSGGYIKTMAFSKNGMAPLSVSGSSSTYYTDGCWYNNGIAAFALFGGPLYSGLYCGAFFVVLDDDAGNAWWTVGASLSYK